MSQYFRPLVQFDPARPAGSVDIASGWCWFDRAQVLERGRKPEIIAADEVPDETLNRIRAVRPDIAGVSMDQPRLMGIINTTPDSFSDGGAFYDEKPAIDHGVRLIDEGADILDVGGESTRPGAEVVDEHDEIKRTEQVIRTLADVGKIPISIDTRKAVVAQTALAAGAAFINDVSGLKYDPQLAEIAAKSGVPICIMHSLPDPKTMQDAPEYDNVLLDVYDHLDAQIQVATDAGIKRQNIIVDPGIGFGKTAEHNLTLMQGLSLFHGLGCPILLGVSRKRFIGTIGEEPDPMARLPGSVALALAGVAKGVQIIRVHDIAETRQALRLWLAATGEGQKT